MQYQYKCKKCGKEAEVHMTMEDYRKSDPLLCCNEEMNRSYSMSAFIPCEGMYKSINARK